MRITIAGGRGFIGSAVARAAQEAGHDVVSCTHDAIPAGDLGTVVYCSGVAWGAESRPVDAYDTHVASLLPILRSTYDRLVYVSSTRVYDRAESTQEDAVLGILPPEARDVYAQSKIAGEALVLAASAENRVVRLSNVFGASLRSELFLSDILRQAANTGRVALRTSLDSAKDYVAVDDVSRAVLQIAQRSERRIYNIAAGRNTSHRALLDAIARVTDVAVEIAPLAPTSIAKPIETERVRAEYGFTASDVVDAIPALLAAFRTR